MICPHCAQENPEGRKYCRVCAKALTQETVSNRPAPAAPPAPPAAAATPVLSKMALASLILSFFSLIVPLGIAAVGLGHVSRNQIAKSGGCRRGTGVAFAGLILGYIQLAVAAVLFVGSIGLVLDFNKEMSKRPEVRAALVARMKYGDLHKVNVEDPAKQQQQAVDALRIIRARQSEYANAHPDEGYACRLGQLGEPLNPETELGGLLAHSHYGMEVERCGTAKDMWYVVIATSRTNYAYSPFYCMDSGGVIYKYNPGRINDVIGRVMAVKPELCPLYGERAEQ